MTRPYRPPTSASDLATLTHHELRDEVERLRNNVLSLQDENEQLKVSLVRICGMAHNDRRVMEVRPRDDVMPGAFIAKLKR